MGNPAKISPRIRSSCLQDTILSFLIIHIVTIRQMNVAIDNPLLFPSVSYLTT
jgi:hypothetical protein